jgi:hypothetical protein
MFPAINQYAGSGLVFVPPLLGRPLTLQPGYASPLVTNWNAPQIFFGAAIVVGITGPTYLYPILPPQIQWANQDALVPPPMQFTTANGSLQGTVDGVNDTFATSVNLSRMQVSVNGVAQTLNVDCCAPWGQFVKFLPGAIPQKGSIITVEGWTNL